MHRSSDRDNGWGSPSWKVVEAGSHNYNPLVEEILKPLMESLIKAANIEVEQIQKTVRGK